MRPGAAGGARWYERREGGRRIDGRAAAAVKEQEERAGKKVANQIGKTEEEKGEGRKFEERLEGGRRDGKKESKEEAA